VNLQLVKEKAREKLATICNVCPECNGRACAGQVPGIGGAGRGRSFQNNYDELAKIKLNMTTIHNKLPQTTCNFFGCQLAAPVIAAPIAGMEANFGDKMSEMEYARNVVQGCNQAGLLAMTGDGISELEYHSGIKAIIDEGGWGIPIFKPSNKDLIYERISQAEKAGVPAVGMDIDGAGLIAMKLGLPPKSKEELREIISATKLPFIIKGIMTVKDALIAIETGAKAIVVSNHGGRVLDDVPATAVVLPEIVKAAKGKTIILVDGGIRTGVDILKMLALGADGVLIGRSMTIGVFGGGTKGVRAVADQLKDELWQAMLMTGCGDLEEINQSIIY
jgi:isopentenyl diphosphate isomerase/L-lactate dehydrogenase-like FMN-dependent dehydrogenase